MNQKYGTCEKPDMDVPKLTCGYPIPCPYHTTIINTTKDNRNKSQIKLDNIKNIVKKG